MDSSRRDGDTRAARRGGVRQPSGGGTAGRARHRLRLHRQGRCRGQHPSRTGTSACSASSRALRAAASDLSSCNVASTEPRIPVIPSSSRRSASETSLSIAETASSSSSTMSSPRPAFDSGRSASALGRDQNGVRGDRVAEGVERLHDVGERAPTGTVRRGEATGLEDRRTVPRDSVGDRARVLRSGPAQADLAAVAEGERQDRRWARRGDVRARRCRDARRGARAEVAGTVDRAHS